MDITNAGITNLAILGAIILFPTLLFLPSIIKDISKKNVWAGTLGLFNFFNFFVYVPIYLFKENYLSLSKIFDTPLNAVEDVLNTTSIILLSVSLIERFYFFSNPEQHKNIFSRKNAKVIILFCLYSVLLSVLKHFPWYIYVKENGSDRLKDNPFPSVELTFVLHTFWAFYPFLFVICFTYLIICKHYKNKISEKGLNKNYIIVLTIKIILIILCKATLIIYKSIALLNNKASWTEQTELLLKSCGWGFTLFMFSDYIFRNKHFKKVCKKCYDFCCKWYSSLTVLKLL